MHRRLPYYPATLLQLSIPLLLLWLLRFVFAFHNAEALGNPSFSRVFQLSLHGFRFDLCAWAYLNAPFILLRFLPFNFVDRKGYRLAANILYLIGNLLLLLPAVADIPFFQFNGAHMRWSSVATLWTDPNMGGIIAGFFQDFWWAFLLGFAIILILCLTAFVIKSGPLPRLRLDKVQEFLLRFVIFLGAGGVTFFCIRGHVGNVRPLSIGEAVWGTSESRQINIVLNTPFCILRTIRDENRIPPFEFFTPSQFSSLRSSLHPSAPGQRLNKKNIMVVAVESGSAIWLSASNPVASASNLGLMPFLDSIASQSVVFPRAYTTGIRSIEGITSLFGGVPTFGDMVLMETPYYANTFDTPATLLGKEGYSNRFYFGANPGSFNIDQTLKTFGFEKVLSRDDYGNDRDFDGEWGIWDHKMGEYAAHDLSTLPQPFIAGWFTLNPHGPFDVPKDWQTEGYVSDDPMRRTVEYEDRAIRRFFEVAKSQPWYMNTIFVIVGDHGCRDLKGTVYDSPLVLPRIMMMVYAPDGSIPPARMDGRSVAQYDLPSTLLSLAGYDKDFVSLGEDIFSDNHSGYALMFIKGGYQVCGTRYAMRMSGDLKKIEGVYDVNRDYELKHPLEEYDKQEVKRMTEWARAFMQDYSVRLNTDGLSVEAEKF